MVNSLKYKLSAYDYKIVSEWFISALETISEGNQEELAPEIVVNYTQILRDLL